MQMARLKPRHFKAAGGPKVSYGSEISLTTRNSLGLGDFAALDAVGADADALGGSVDEGVDGLQVGVPPTPGYVVRVRDVIAELRTFAANVAYLCHGSNSRIFSKV